MKSQETNVSDLDQDDELANLYEFLVLNGLAVPRELEPAMQAAHRRVHTRGLDPLRRAA